MSRAWQYGAVVLLVSLAAGCGGRSTNPKADPAVVAQVRASVGSTLDVSASGGDVEFKQSPPDGWVTLTGQFIYDGTAPVRKSINSMITKDKEACAPGTVLSKALIVNPDNGGIENVVVYLATEPKRKTPIHDSAKTPSGEAPVFDQIACVFTPHVLPVHIGRGSLELKNSDNVGHNAAVAAKNGKTIGATIPANSSIRYELTAEEQSPVGATCTIHSWMKGYVMPRSNGYFAVTDKDGKFTIPNLPAGDQLVIRVWHESAGQTKFIKCKADSSQGIKFDKKGFKITLDVGAGAATDLSFKIPASTFK